MASAELINCLVTMKCVENSC